MTTTHNRDDVACMMRVRNEGRWIRACLERTFQVAKRVVLLDDGSTDSTVMESLKAVGVEGVWHLGDKGSPGLVRIHQGVVAGLESEIHVLHSPFRPATIRPQQAVSEIRDKNYLWEYCKSNVPFRHMLCLDGDEMLSLQFIRYFHTAIAELEMGGVDVLSLPFLYLWDSDEQIRVDGIYGLSGDGIPTLRFPRLFTIDRLGGAGLPGKILTPGDMLHVMRFSWQGTKGGFHCGSVPREMFRPLGTDPTGGAYGLPIIHLGYRDDKDRQRKFVFYNEIDPNNEFEGYYRHIIGEPDQHAPGPVRLKPFTDS